MNVNDINYMTDKQLNKTQWSETKTKRYGLTSKDINDLEQEDLSFLCLLILQMQCLEAPLGVGRMIPEERNLEPGGGESRRAATGVARLLR